LRSSNPIWWSPPLLFLPEVSFPVRGEWLFSSLLIHPSSWPPPPHFCLAHRRSIPPFIPFHLNGHKIQKHPFTDFLPFLSTSSTAAYTSMA
jgi:hypothetical protein